MKKIGRDCIEKRIKAVTTGGGGEGGRGRCPTTFSHRYCRSAVGVDQLTIPPGTDMSVDMETLVDDFVTFYVAGKQ